MYSFKPKKLNIRLEGTQNYVKERKTKSRQDRASLLDIFLNGIFLKILHVNCSTVQSITKLEERKIQAEVFVEKIKSYDLIIVIVI